MYTQEQDNLFCMHYNSKGHINYNCFFIHLKLKNTKQGICQFNKFCRTKHSNGVANISGDFKPENLSVADETEDIDNSDWRFQVIADKDD